MFYLLFLIAERSSACSPLHCSVPATPAAPRGLLPRTWLLSFDKIEKKSTFIIPFSEALGAVLGLEASKSPVPYQPPFNSINVSQTMWRTGFMVGLNFYAVKMQPRSLQERNICFTRRCRAARWMSDIWRSVLCWSSAQRWSRSQPKGHCPTSPTA